MEISARKYMLSTEYNPLAYLHIYKFKTKNVAGLITVQGDLWASIILFLLLFDYAY